MLLLTQLAYARFSSLAGELWMSDTYCALNRVCLHSFPIETIGPLSRVYNHLPTLLPTITSDIHALTFNPLSRMLAVHSAPRIPSCFKVGAIRTLAYINSDGRPLLASLETTSMTTAAVDSVLTLDTNQPSR